MRVTAIDFETANSSPASVCAVGLSVLEDGLIEPVLETLIRPEKNVSAFYYGNIRIHGIRPQDVVHAPDYAQVYKEIPVPSLRYFDTVELGRNVFPGLEHHRLNDLCEYLDIELDHHRAGSDAYGCLMIVARVMTLTGIYDIEEMLSQCRTRIYTL